MFFPLRFGIQAGKLSGKGLSYQKPDNFKIIIASSGAKNINILRFRRFVDVF